MDESLFEGQNAAYAQAMFEEYARNPDGVPSEWRKLFEGRTSSATVEKPRVPDTRDRTTTPAPDTTLGPARVSTSSDGAEHLRRVLPVVSRATALVQAFRDHGHQLARIDPLGSEPPGHPQLSPAFFGTSMEELAELPASLVMEENGEDRSVADALNDLVAIYAGSIGYEFEHLDDHVKVGWLWDQVESESHLPRMSADEKCELLLHLSEVEGLEQFLHKAYLGQKRFSLEGTDALVPMLHLTIEQIARAGGREVILGMAHRGRLNVLTHIVGISYGELLAEFEGPSYQGGQLDTSGTGDVKYHHGARGTRDIDGLGPIRIELAPNPSHLEFINPVVAGMARSRQFKTTANETSPDTHSVVPILIHGDAAFAAEGVVAETLNLARLSGYGVGGTIHFILNNQVGFTTDPQDGRSTMYASDLAKGYGIPVLHVNADDAEACLAAVRLAAAYRSHFGDDFVIDLVGYRRHGHNEGDEPAYTQPVEYENISNHPTVRTIYADQLAAEAIVSPAESRAMQDEITSKLREAQDRVREYEPVSGDTLDDEREIPVVPRDTGVDFKTLAEINAVTVQLPDGFTPHSKLWRQLEPRIENFSPTYALDWGHAEMLALGSLLKEGIPIRLTGQDTQRGTFSHRHMVLHDVKTGDVYTPLDQVSSTRLEVYNSPLTETAVIGFEYGYSVGADTDVVLWEAQFGDFVNVGQVMIDQFISSGLTKWGQYSRLTLLLPHGYEGQGPEHSSARIERFLQLCAEGNMRVTYPTTPAQYFHLLRRQALRRPERPMIVMTPKSLLRHGMASSNVAELLEGAFRHVINDATIEDHARVKRLVLCTGKVFYDMQGHPKRVEASSTAIARMELLYPFPEAALEELLASYPNLEKVFWMQEEPRNMGALTFVGPRLRAIVPRNVPLAYVARPERASPAEGKAIDHAAQQAELVLEALGLSGESTG